MKQVIEEFYKYFMDADKKGALAFIDNWAQDHSYEEAMVEIVEPALQKFGNMWAKQLDVNLAQGYIAAKISEGVFMRISEERKRNNSYIEINGIAVLGNIEDDYHSLGRRMVKNFLFSAGWKIYDLGNDVLAEDFVNKAIEVNATIIGASAMMYTNAKNMIKIRKELDSRNLSNKIMFAVGGTIFNLRPSLVEEVGADGTARNAMEAVELFNRLSKKIN